jgi:hypothetical protein
VDVYRPVFRSLVSTGIYYKVWTTNGFAKLVGSTRPMEPIGSFPRTLW